MTRLSLLSPSDYQRTRWKNDGGWTTELARSGGEDFRWRCSIADIERDGPFSPFPGIERDLLLLEGNGMELDIAGIGTRRLTHRFERVHFPGEAAVDCNVLAGPTRDFNVMARRDAVRAEVVARPLVGPMVIFPDPACEWLLHMLTGEAHARTGDAAETLAAGSTLHLDFRTATPHRVVLDGAGELVLVKFVPVTPA